MPADLILANDGIKYAGGNIIDLKAAMPTTGSYVAGDIVIESTTGQRISGWKRLTTGSNHVLGTDWAYVSASPQLGTAVATTSGTAIDFTGIPSWVKRVTLLLSDVSTTGTNDLLVQVGAGSIVSTGYAGNGWNGAAYGVAATTAGLMAARGLTAASSIQGRVIFNLVTGNTWVGESQVTFSNTPLMAGGVTKIALGGTLDRIRLTTVGGTDTFDAGSVNILWE